VVASAATHYFHDAKLISIEQVRGVCAIDSPLGIFTVQLRYGRTPRIHIGPIRVSVEREAHPGDELRILDENDREYSFEDREAQVASTSTFVYVKYNPSKVFWPTRDPMVVRLPPKESMDS
jgi:hypothetical protein